MRLGFGLGLRKDHHAAAMTGVLRPGGTQDEGVDWFEVITENFLVDGGNPRRVLREVRAHWPVVLHGVSLSIGSTDPLDEHYLDRVAALATEIEPALVSDHLCWTALGGHGTHDLLPMPYTDEALAHVAARVHHVQERLGRTLVLENPSTYAAFRGAEMSEAAFLAELSRRTDCGLLLDVNNVFVSCANHGWDAAHYLETLPARRVAYCHLAGHSYGEHLLIDTHDAPVTDAVWQLYTAATRRFPHAGTCIERDDHVPPLAELLAELARARELHDMNLHDQLAAFHAIVVGAAPIEAARTLVEGGEIDELERVGVYVHAYLARIAGVLANDYPKLVTLHRLDTAAYLRAHPSRHFSLREVGQHVATFLAAHGEPPHLVDLARLERARLEAFDGGRDATPLDREALAALGPAAFPTVILRLVPSATLVELAFNADDLWDAIESATAPPEPIAVPRTVLVWRRDVTVVHRTLAADEAPLVRLLATGATFEDICEQLAETADPVSRALELLMKWLDGGILA